MSVGSADREDPSTKLPRFEIKTFWKAQQGRIDLAGTRVSDDTLAADTSHIAAFLRRSLDIIWAILLLLLTAPVMLATVLLIWLESPGPVIYRQERVGLNGRHFTMWKFRSMRQDAERQGPECVADSFRIVPRLTTP